jgi:hypothetical protein
MVCLKIGTGIEKMARLDSDKCNCCGKTLYFFYTRDNDYTFCNSDCRDVAYRRLETYFCEEDVRDQTIAIHASACPHCHGQGALDVHYSFLILSCITFTYARATPHVCCRKCGRIAQVKTLLGSFFLGWWSVGGILVTPIYIIRNIIGLFRKADPYQPSHMLYSLIWQQNEIRIMKDSRLTSQISR